MYVFLLCVKYKIVFNLIYDRQHGHADAAGWWWRGGGGGGGGLGFTTVNRSSSSIIKIRQ